MKALKIILIVLLFLCLIVGLALAFLPNVFVSNKNSKEVAERKALKVKLIGYVLLMMSLAFGIFQSLITL